jgi:formate hydrogenlyase subunit 3/multisubunit Na+/H+ antiporter MnhD subunit
MGSSSYSGSDFGGVYWAIFGGGIALIAGYFLLKKLKRADYLMSVVAAVSIVCAAVIFYGIMTISSGKRILLFRVGPDDVNLRFHVGSFGTLLGFVLAWIGALPTGVSRRWLRRDHREAPLPHDLPKLNLQEPHTSS